MKIVTIPSVWADCPAFQRLVEREEQRRAQLAPLERELEDLAEEALTRAVLGLPPS